MENENKKSKKLLWVVLLILVIAGLAVGGYFYLNSKTTAKSIFTSKINETVKGFKNETNFETGNVTLSLSGNLETQKEEYKQIADILKTAKLKFNTQVDFKEKTEYVDLDVDYNNQKFLKGNVFYKNGDDNIYVYVDGLFDKYLKAPLSQADESGELRELLNSFFEKKNDTASTEKAINIVKDELLSKLEDKYYSQETVDGAKKSTLKLTFAELKNIITTICEDLDKNEEFLGCFEKKDDVKEMLAQVISLAKSEGTEYDSMNLEVSLYTKGLLANEVVKTEITVTEGTTTATFVVNKVDKENYEFKLNVKADENSMVANVETLNGTLKVHKTGENAEEVVLTVDVPELGKVTLNLDYSFVTNKEVTKPDVTNSVDVNNLSDADMQKIYTNMQQMPLFSILGMF